jgi:hypothetical protein
MAREGGAKQRSGYAWQTLRSIHSAVFVLPLLLFFQWGAVRYGSDLVMPRVIHGFLKYFGGMAIHLPAVLIMAVLVARQFMHRNDTWQIHGKVLVGMTVESIFWTGPLIALSFMTGQAMMSGSVFTWSPETDRVLQQALQAVGAGVYEEFVFRLVFIDLVLLVLVDLAGLSKEPVAVGAVIVAAVVFSLCHFPSEAFSGQVHFSRARFIFLAMAGVYWGALYLFRGFGIAVGCHVLWDVYALMVRGTG